MSGGLDLSVGSVVILADVMGAQLINGRDDMVLPIVALVLAVGLLIGLINGLLITRFRVTPFIATLGTNFAVYGIALIFSAARRAARFRIASAFGAMALRSASFPLRRWCGL